MTHKVPDIYLDTSVIFAAVLSPLGGSRKLLQLSEVGTVRIVLGPHTLKEAENGVRRKMLSSLPDLARLLSCARVELRESVGLEHLQQAVQLVSYQPDARVLAEAMAILPDWFITHDKAQFLRDDDLKHKLPFKLGTPGDLLQELKRTLLVG
jgi:predicted nucleic acid-binding protein